MPGGMRWWWSRPGLILPQNKKTEKQVRCLAECGNGANGLILPNIKISWARCLAECIGGAPGLILPAPKRMIYSQKKMLPT